MKTVLTIAGSDCSGGAGIQADIKTITAHGQYAMSAVTALTAQNTLGVFGIAETSAAFVSQQLDCIFTDIFPDAVKIGMVSNAETIAVIADKLTEYHARNLVIDPVMISTSGSTLLCKEALDALRTRLLPLGTVITPNLPEAAALCGFPIATEDEMLRAAQQLGGQLGTAVLVKGGHLRGAANDLLYADGQLVWYAGAKIDNPNTHGTGCTLSSAIACHLADGNSLQDSVRHAKAYLTAALCAGLKLGKGAGPLNHMTGLTLSPAVAEEKSI